MKTQFVKGTDKVYKLTGNQAPLSFIIPVRNTAVSPLLWFDEENNINRPLRYASNQKSPFEDEQDGNVIVQPIIFNDGMLQVPKNNPVLQEFLYYHPMNGVVFQEVDNERDAKKEVEMLMDEADALIEARQLSVDDLETVARVLFGQDVSNISTAELRRDVLIYAKNDPQHFLSVCKDPALRYRSKIQKFFDLKLLSFRNNNKEVWFNTDTNKKKMLSLPYGVDPYEAVGEYLQSDEGLDSLKMLEKFAE